MTVPVYPRHQDSGVDWIGLIPAGWQTEPLKVGYSVVGGATPRSEVEDYWDGGVPWVTPGDLSKLTTPFIGETIRTISELGLAACAATKVPTGSVILSTRAPIGSLGITTEPATTNQGCKALVPRRGANPRFLAYTLSVATKALNVRGKGTTFLELSGDELARFKVPTPSPAEQVAIAAFLDRETGKIDALVDAQRRLMDLQAERIASIAMARVGTDWTRLGNLIEVVDRPVALEAGELYTRIGLYNRGRGLFHKEPTLGCDIGDSQFFWIESGDLILSGQFAWEGAVALAGDTETGAVVSHRYPVLRGREGAMCTEAIFAVLTSHYGNHVLRENSRGAAGRNRPLNLRSLLKEPVPVLTRASQELVTDAVRGRAEAAAEMNRLEALLLERRAALISAAVTGKIDVRSFVPEQVKAA